MQNLFKRNLTKEAKVTQLAGYIDEKLVYWQLLINLMQSFVRSNNLNLLAYNRQYRIRDAGGLDHTSARYIFTLPMLIARTMFDPADDPIFKYLNNNNNPTKIKCYMLIIPMILFNKAESIGMGKLLFII